MPKALPRSFHATDAETLARKLLGKILVRRDGDLIRRARIVETEAYVGAHDLACHAAKGRTPRTEVMFGRPGFAYVYLVYGMHHLLNVVCGEVGEPQAVLLRAAEPLSGLDGADLSGPGKLCRAMDIKRGFYGADLTRGDLFFIDDGARPAEIRATPRIGVDYAGDWRDKPLRFFDDASRFISRR